MAARAAGNVRVIAALVMAMKVDARNKNLFRIMRFVPALCVQGVCKVAHSGRAIYVFGASLESERRYSHENKPVSWPSENRIRSA